MSCLFTEYLTVASSADMYLMVLVEEGLGSLWENLVWMLTDEFIPFFLACMDYMEPIYLMFVLEKMFAIFKGY